MGWSHGWDSGEACRVERQRWSWTLLPENLPRTRRSPSSLLGDRTEWFPRRLALFTIDAPTGRGKKNLGKGDRPGGRGPDPEAAVEGTGLLTFLPGQNSKTLFRLCHHPICHKSVQTALLRVLLSPQAPHSCSLSSNNHQWPSLAVFCR